MRGVLCQAQICIVMVSRAVLWRCCCGEGVRGCIPTIAAADFRTATDPSLCPAPFTSLPACGLQETVRFNFLGGSYSLGQLLPMRFRPADLLPDPATPLLLQPQDNPVQLTAAARALLRERAGEPAFVRAAAEALQEAVGSYAPYSRCPAGLAIVTAEGDVYSGGYVESAAYNPSMPPLQTAIVDAVIGEWERAGWAGWGGGWGEEQAGLGCAAGMPGCLAVKSRTYLPPPPPDTMAAILPPQTACPATPQQRR